MHKYISLYLIDCLENGAPTWMTKGRIVLIQKDKDKGRDVSNYRPITCLPLMWKLLTGVIADQMYNYLETNNLLPEEQKGCRKRSKGTADLLYIDRMILREVRARKKNLGVGWIDYQKAYDNVAHSWVLECLTILGIDGKVTTFLKNSVKSWEVELKCGNESLGNVKIRRGIFQGDTLSPLLFVIALIPLTYILRKCRPGYEFAKNGEKINHLLYMDDLKLYARSEKDLDSLIQSMRVFSKDIGMQSGVKKCAVLIMKRGRQIKSDGVKIPGSNVIRSLQENDGYKYLGVLQNDEMKEKEMKEIVTKEYKRRVRKVVETKLNGGNIIKAINTWAIPVLRYSAPFLKWRKTELQELDRRTRKLLTMHNAHHPKSNVERIYIPRKEGGRGLLNVEDTVNTAILGLEEYVVDSNERILSAARNIEEVTETAKGFKKRKKNERKNNWKEKELHGQYLRQTEEVAGPERWVWLKDGNLKRETESLIISAQEQAIRTNVIKAKIDKTQIDSKCRMCGKVDESISHVLNECSKLVQKEYKRRHDCVGKRVHWVVSKVCGFKVKDKWYEHEPEAVIVNDDYRILWDFSIETDHAIEARRPDMIVEDRRNRQCKIIDFAVPYDNRVDNKEAEKIDKYQDLAREIKRLWNTQVKIIPVVVGALGTTPGCCGRD